VIKLTLKSMFDRKVRFALTSFAIVIGVAFSVASFVLTDSLSKTFDQVASDIQEGIDLTVRSRLDFGDESLRPPVPRDVLDTVRSVPGAEQAAPRLFFPNIVPFKESGDPLRTFGPPLIGVNYTPDAGPLSQLLQVSGRPPAGPAEFNLDVDTADRGDFEVGKSYLVSGPAGTRRFELVGLVAFGTSGNQTAGAVISAFDTETAAEFFAKGNNYDEVAVAVSPGADLAEVTRLLEEILPANLEVVGSDVVVAESRDQFQTIVSLFRNVLLAFAIVMAVVAAFIINNTFTIVLGQRTRELALLRALGASGKQVTRTVVGEALVVGVFATVVGLAAGIALAFGLRELLDALGFALPSGDVEIQPRTIAVAVLIGVGITVAVSLVPARRARRVPPVAALRDDFHVAGPGLRRRLVTGGVVAVAGAASMALGLFGGLATAQLLAAIGVGALLVFIGVNLLSPTISRPVAYVLGSPFRRFSNVAGRLSQENAARNPRRTASTASALMIGLALVTMASVIGASLTKSFLGTLDDSVQADFIIRPSSQNNLGFTSAVQRTVADIPGVGDAVAYRVANQSARIDGRTKSISATDLSRFSTQLDIDITAGSIEGAGLGALLVEDDAAKSSGIALGDTVAVTFVTGETQDLTVVAIYDDGSLLGNWIIDLSTWERHFPTLQDDFLVSATLAPGADPVAVRAAIDAATRDFPVRVENREEFKQSARDQVDSLLVVIQVFLGIALAIAALGIANTLALSIFERTRELGLLRAVGMSRRQARRMIRYEAVIVAVFGGLLGVALGIVFGVAGSLAIPDTVVDTVSIPVVSIVMYLVVAMVIGLVASLGPARRAGRLNVLDAISYQ
jgi:putative ABC transport system permease protein